MPLRSPGGSAIRARHRPMSQACSSPPQYPPAARSRQSAATSTAIDRPAPSANRSAVSRFTRAASARFGGESCRAWPLAHAKTAAP